MTKTLWLDVDGVLLDWVRPFLEYVQSPVSYDNLTQYDFSYLFKGGTSEMVDAINEFNKTSIYENLKPMISLCDLPRLRNAEYDLNIISQVDGELARQLRINNLENVFGKYTFGKIVLTGRGEKKTEVLRKLEPYDTIHVVEDNPGFFKDAEKDGHIKGMAINHPYNCRALRELDVPIYFTLSELTRHLLCQ